MQEVLNSIYNQTSLFSMKLLCDVGEITEYSNAGDAVSGLSKILGSVGIAVGSLCIALAIIKLIISIADENAKAKMDATILFGVGIVFLSATTITDTLIKGPNGNGTSLSVSAVMYRALSMIGKMLSWSGAILAAMSVIMLIFSVAQENAETQAKATTTLGVAVGFLSFSSGISKLYAALSAFGYTNNGSVNQAGQNAAENLVTVVLNFISSVCVYIGGAIVVLAVFRLIMSIREENSKDRDTAIKLLLVGIALVSIQGAFKLFGLS